MDLGMSQSPMTTSYSPSATAGGTSRLVEGSRLTGDLHIPGLVELLGHVDGSVSADSIVIDERGTVVGGLHAASITVRGKFDGRIEAVAVKLQSTAAVSGEIVYGTLSIESGAMVDAVCKVRTQA
jgi:cytoskeletal protein CcmA (bactofilin family)